MKKLILFVSAIAAFISPVKLERTLLQEKTANLYDENITNIVAVYGSPQISSDYVTDILLQVSADGKQLYEIVPPENQGYDPNVEIISFTGNYPQIFYSAMTGGSGGYGNYYVYNVTATDCTKIFDVAEASAGRAFTAQFIDDCRMDLSGLVVDVSYMDDSFKSQIFGNDCSVQNQVEINVNAISNVFPYYNAAEQRYQLQTYRSVTAIAEINRLGYIVELLDFDNGKFTPYMTDFSIGLPN